MDLQMSLFLSELPTIVVIWCFLRLPTSGLLPAEAEGESARGEGCDEHVGGQFCVFRGSVETMYSVSSSLTEQEHLFNEQEHLKMSSHSNSQVTKALLLVQAEQGNMGIKERQTLY